MDFTVMGEKKLKATLTKEELEAFDLTAEGLDGCDQKTKRLVGVLLDRAKREVGFNIGTLPVLVEAFSSRAGGCEIFISALAEGGGGERVRECLFVFESLEALLKACAALLAAGYQGKSRTYFCDGRYCLGATFPTHQDGPTLFDLAAEFGCPDRVLTSETAEKKGKLLCQKDAVFCYGGIARHSLSS